MYKQQTFNAIKFGKRQWLYSTTVQWEPEQPSDEIDITVWALCKQSAEERGDELALERYGIHEPSFTTVELARDPLNIEQADLSNY